VLLVPVELYLIMRVACATASWANVLAGIKRDGWAQQARAEQGGAGKHPVTSGSNLAIRAGRLTTNFHKMRVSSQLRNLT
jgi:hypothetical protein